ncbi:hypothetical protein ACSSUR_08570 [Pseudomonas cedrina]|uniref:hypothetical protein n=1 Tax=Pseudomonas cedrina TaxID=651740 RepID=UPI003ED9DB97
MNMYENLEAFNALGYALLERLTPITSGEVSVMQQQWPAAPGDYFAFMQERGHGEIKEDDSALPLLTILPTLCPAAADYFGDDGIYKDGPYEPGARGEMWLFGWDSAGIAFGFDSGDNWRLLEIDNMRWITRLDLSFCQFVEGLLVCYPQRPVSFANGVWRDSGDVSYNAPT